jgi:hypothetical protein
MSINAELLDNAIKEKITSVFPNNNFTITYSKKFCIISTNDGKCLAISFYNDHLHINTLHKCENTGSKSLEMVEQLAKLIPNIHYISLDDGSSIKICGYKILLFILKILTKGQSWYNSLGYVSEYYADELEDNSNIINMEYNAFIDRVYENNLNTFMRINSIERLQFLIDNSKYHISKIEIKYNIMDTNDTNNIDLITDEDDKVDYLDFKQRIEDDLNKINHYATFIDEYKLNELDNIRNGPQIFPDIDINTTVQDYFNKIWNDITNKSCDDEVIKKKCKWLSFLLNIIDDSKTLNYNQSLKKMIKVSTGSNGGRKRNYKTKKYYTKRINNKNRKVEKSKKKIEKNKRKK